MRDDWTVLRTALLAAAWRPIRQDPGQFGLMRLLGWAAALIAVWIASQYWHTRDTAGAFNLYGLNAMAAWLALLLVVTGLFVRPARRLTFLVVSVALYVVLEIAFEILTMPAMPYLTAFIGDSWWRGVGVWLVTLGLYSVWWVGAAARILDRLQPEQAPSLKRAAAMWTAALAAFALMPHYPSFIGRDFHRANANMWEFARAAAAYYAPSGAEETKPSIDLASIELAQPFLVEAMTAQLLPERPGRTDIYFVGVAGWAEQDVFYRELTGALDVIDRSMSIEGRVALLVNNSGSTSEVPLANRQNFAAIIREVGRRMNKDEDVLFMFMTSHGSRDGIALSLPGSVQALLSPQDVSAVLDREGIKNRIIVVSACYSGIFVRPLANDDTIVLTAADENSTSFGCSNDREWTYFGDALFKHSFKPGQDLPTSFEQAKALIGAWEAKDSIPASNPQAHFGASLLSRLAPLHAAGGDALPERHAQQPREEQAAAIAGRAPQPARP
jgi:hypothetical protein